MSVTIIMPAYNASRFLREAIDSALGQTLSPDEVIVVDDGSTDDTATIAENYGPPVRVFRRPNARQAASRNFGVTQAKSEWVAFHDADDIWERNKLELQLKELTRHPEADVCYTGHVLLMQEGETTRRGTESLPPDPGKVREALYEGPALLIGCTMMRRATFLEFGGFNAKYRYTEDYEFFLRLLMAGIGFVACPEPLLLYRRHGTNTVTGLSWMEECLDLHRQYIYPSLPKRMARSSWNAFRSEREAEAAYTLRKLGDPRCSRFMARSIIHRVFFQPLRYKVLAHMMYSRFRKMLKR